MTQDRIKELVSNLLLDVNDNNSMQSISKNYQLENSKYKSTEETHSTQKGCIEWKKLSNMVQLKDEIITSNYNVIMLQCVGRNPKQKGILQLMIVISAAWFKRSYYC